MVFRELVHPLTEPRIVPLRKLNFETPTTNCGVAIAVNRFLSSRKIRLLQAMAWGGALGAWALLPFHFQVGCAASGRIAGLSLCLAAGVLGIGCVIGGKVDKPFPGGVIAVLSVVTHGLCAH